MEQYAPGSPNNKPDVLKQIKEIDEQRSKMMQQQQQQHQQMQQQYQPQIGQGQGQGQPQLMMNRPGMEPIALTTMDCLNIMQQQKEQIDALLKKVQILEELCTLLREKKESVPLPPSIPPYPLLPNKSSK